MSEREQSASDLSWERGRVKFLRTAVAFPRRLRCETPPRGVILVFLTQV